MPHCTNCGKEVPVNAQFCQNCGQSQPASAAGPATGPAPVSNTSSTGLSENAAATLSYALGWLTGIIFFLIDHRPYVRFHAAQSIVTFGGLHIIRIILGIIFGVGWGFGFGMGYGVWGIGALLLACIGLISFVLWIICMVKAFQGQRWKVPIAGDFAENLAGRQV
jgi:uncharacterized membrane protein